MLKNALMVLTLTLLTGCGEEFFNFGTRIPLETYDKEFLDKAANEYDRLNRSSKIRVMVDDYGKLRELVRCSNALPKKCEGPV